MGVIGLGKGPRTHRVMFSVEKLGYPWDTLELQSLGLGFKSWALGKSFTSLSLGLLTYKNKGVKTCCEK